MKSLILLATLLISAIPAASAGTFTGTFTGVFSDPVFAGFYLNTYGIPVYSNNTVTAVTTGFPGETVTWGSYPTSTFPLPPGTDPFSTLSYGPAIVTDLPGSPVSDPLQNQTVIGQIIYTNGTSELTSLIFGMTLTISFDDPTVTPIVLPFSIVTTANTGIDPDYDADLIVFQGLGPGGSDISLHVYEGQTIWVDVFGSIVGDPVGTFGSFNLSGGGFVGNGPLSSPVLVPEPSTGVLAGVVLAAAAASRLRRS